MGYVGAAQIAGVPTDEWLYDFIGLHFNFRRLEEVAENLRTNIEKQRLVDEGHGDPEPLLVHLAGFEQAHHEYIPRVWFIRNVWGMDDHGYIDFRKEFQASEEVAKSFANRPIDQVRAILRTKAEDFDPFWYHQGFDLGTFNTIEAFLKAAFKTLCQHVHAGHAIPKTLSDWESQVKFSILTYGSYFAAYRGPSEQFVGGGVDVVSVPWP